MLCILSLFCTSSVWWWAPSRPSTRLLACPPPPACPTPPPWCPARCNYGLWWGGTLVVCRGRTGPERNLDPCLLLLLFIIPTSLFSLMRAISLLKVFLTKSCLMKTLSMVSVCWSWSSCLRSWSPRISLILLSLILNNNNQWFSSSQPQLELMLSKHYLNFLHPSNEGVGGWNSTKTMHCGPPCVVITRKTFCHGSGSYYTHFCFEMLNSQEIEFWSI